MITLTLPEIGRMIAEYTEIGYMAAVKAYDPPQDRLRLSEVRKWLRANHIAYKDFQSLVKQGVVTPVHAGSAKNSPLFFSKKEIKQGFAAVCLHRCLPDEV